MDQPEYDVFITAASTDMAWANRIAKELTASPFELKVMQYDEDIAPDEPLPDAMRETLTRVQHLVVVWSSAAEKSVWIRDEIAAFESMRASDPADRRLVFVTVSGDVPAHDRSWVVDDLRDPKIQERGATRVPRQVWNRFVMRLIEAIARPMAEDEAIEKLDARDEEIQSQALSTPASAATGAGTGSLVSEYVDPATRWDLFPSVLEILKSARDLAAVAEPAQPDATADREITTVFLLIAISGRGSVTAAPRWAPDWLHSRYGAEGHSRLVADYPALAQAKKRRGPSPAEIPLSQGAGRAFEQAENIARRTSRGPPIHVRHVLAALLIDERGPAKAGALGRLAHIGQDVTTLRESFFDFVRGYGDDDDAWGEILLGRKEEPWLLSGFEADAGVGDDYLDIRPDVAAFAGLIAARTVTPPLSIGLFGEWGSGKTFFMNMLRDEVARLAREAREASARDRIQQRDQTFYRRIVQIEFNAWHYAEGNLWASLVQHIFDNLRLVDDRKRVSADLQQPILEKLGAEKTAEAQAAREREQAENMRAAAEEELNAAREQFELKASELASISRENVLADLPVPEVHTAIAPTLKALGLTEVTENALELRSTLGDAKALLSRGNAALLPLLRSKDRKRRWMNLILTLLAGPAAALAAGLLASLLGPDGIASISAASGGLAAFLAAGTRWLRPQLEWVDEHVQRLETAHRSLDERIAREQAGNMERIRKAQEQLRLYEADYVAAKRREEDAKRRVAAAEAKLSEASVTRLLTSFIEDRANSNDYRKHLGVLALVRNDFERLSDLIAEENEQLAAPRDGKPDPFPDYDTEIRDEAKRINRIVLYIDDLDRCPPAKVVEVLEAVHLLLAFPLFVVVVGVDARWIVRSLDARYRELLKTDGTPTGDERLREFNELFGRASAHDYVEKIFQVPFWLKPMSDNASRRMIRGLLAASMAADATGISTDDVDRTAGDDAMNGDDTPHYAAAFESGDGPSGVLPPGDQSDEKEIQHASDGSDEAERHAGPDTPDESTQSEGQTASDGSGGTAESRRTSPDLHPESLEISSTELTYMSELAPLLGRSPRTLKRFVNVYRLIKIGLSPYERYLFLRDADGLPDYRAVLTLLAIDTGAPQIAPTFLAVLSGLAEGRWEQEGDDGQRVQLDPTIPNLITVLEGDETVNRTEDWARVRSWLEPQPGQFRLPAELVRIARWVPRVSRFSFHTGRI